MARTIPEWIGRTDDAMPPDRVRLRILNRQRPAPGEPPICPICSTPIYDGQGVDYDHRVALADGGENRETNFNAVHRRCHRHKTAKEALARAEARGSQKRAYGIKRSRNPIPGSRASKWKRRMDGTTERREPAE
jgi:5-methylcytosine-specific restriction endonuclease McrA